MNQITINCELCEADGFRVQYRELNSDDDFIALPDVYTETPIIFTESTYPDGTEFEGYITSVCGNRYGNPVPWSTAEVETTWGGIHGFCETITSCAEGYTLSDDGSICVMTDTVPATPPSGGGGTPGVAERVSSSSWNRGGGRVYAAGYPESGEGVLVQSLIQTPLFVNGNVQWGPGNDTIKSRMNAAGVWAVGGVPNNEYIGFSRKINVLTPKTVYIAMSADNAFRIVLNGDILVDCGPSGNIAGGSNFNYLHIYPANLIAGDNFIEMYAVNFGSVAGMVAEIYDTDLAGLMAAVVEADLHLLFSTKDMDGEEFNLGETAGYSCPPDYSYDPDANVCVRIQTQDPMVINTGMLAYEDRERLENGVPDGYQEPNIDGVGIGEYVPPVENLDACPI